MAITLNDAEKIFESDSWDTIVDQMSDKELSDLMSAFQSTNDYARREKNTDNYIYVQNVGEKRLKDLEGKDFSTMSASELDGVFSLLETFGSSTAEIDSIKKKYEERLSVLRAESENSASSDNTGQGQEQNNIQTSDETPATETPDIEQETEKANEVEKANIARISDFYGIDQIQSPEQVEANIASLSSLPNDEECFKDEAFKDVKRLLDSIEVHHDIMPAPTIGLDIKDKYYNNDMQMFCETVRRQTEMYLANISPSGVTPEDFKQEYADRLSTHLASVLGIDTAIKSKPSQESISQLLDGLANGQKHVIESSTLIGWQAAQHAEMDKATDLISQKKGYENVARSFKQKVHELKDKVQEKYPKSYSLAKTALTSAGWGAAFSIGASFGPVGLAAVSAASFANSSYQLYKDYKHQKEEHLKIGEKYNFFSYVKENKLRCLSTMLSGLSAAVGGVSLGGIDASALQNVVSRSRQIVGYAMAASSAFKAAGDAWNKTEGSWWDKLKSSAHAAVTSLASFAVGYAAGQTAGAVVGDIAGTPAQEQQDTTQNTAQQTGQTLASQTIQPVRENITMPVDTPSQVSQPQVLDAQVMGGATPPVHETPTPPVHETPTAPVHETTTAPGAGTTTLEAQENPEMPNTGPHVGWMTENGDSYVFNQETQEFTYTSGSEGSDGQTTVVRDQETFRDIYTRLQNGEQISQEDIQFGREHLGQTETPAAPGGETTLETETPTSAAHETPEMPHVGAYEGRMTDSGVSFVINHETGEISVSGTNPEIEQAASSLAANSSLSVEQAQNMLQDREVFSDITTRSLNGESVSQEEVNWAYNYQEQLAQQGLKVNLDGGFSLIHDNSDGTYSICNEEQNEIFRDITTRSLNGESVSQEEVNWAYNYQEQLAQQGLKVNLDGGLSLIQNNPDGTYSVINDCVDVDDVVATRLSQLDQNEARVETLSTPLNDGHINQDEQTIEAQENSEMPNTGRYEGHLTESGVSYVINHETGEITTSGTTPELEQAANNLAENSSLSGEAAQQILQEHEAFKDIIERAQNNEQISQEEVEWAHNYASKITELGLKMNPDWSIEPSDNSSENETQSDQKEQSLIDQTSDKQHEALSSAKDIADKAGIQLLGAQAVNLPQDYMNGHGNISVVCDQNDMIVSMKTPDGHTQSVCASLGEDGKYSFQKIDENGNASPMSDKEIKAFQKDVLKPAARAAEAYHEKNGTPLDFTNRMNISFMQDAMKSSNIAR